MTHIAIHSLQRHSRPLTTGLCSIFNHVTENIPHDGEAVVQGVKYLLRTDIVIRRCDDSHVPLSIYSDQDASASTATASTPEPAPTALTSTAAAAQAEIVFIVGVMGTGKTTAGDYLAEYCDFHHVDGDNILHRSAMDKPDWIKPAGDMSKAAFEFWFKDKPCPESMWRPYMSILCLQIEEAVRQHSRVTVSFAVYRREVRDFLRSRLGRGLRFLRLECDVDILVQSSFDRLREALDASHTSLSEWWDSRNPGAQNCGGQARYGDFSFAKFKQMQQENQLNGMADFDDDESAYSDTVDVSSRDSAALCNVSIAIGVVPNKLVVDIVKLKAIAKTRMDRLMQAWKELRPGKKYSLMQILQALNSMHYHDPDWLMERQQQQAALTKQLAAQKRVSECFVIARVRPLLATEAAKGIGVLPGMVQKSSLPAHRGKATVLRTNSGDIGGFEAVLGPEATNHRAFEACLQSRLGTVLEGGTVCLFGYGYTGSGKTHSVLGYGAEEGMFELGAQALLARLPRAKAGEGELFLSASALELYGDTVWDLGGPIKVKCSLRKDECGQLHVSRPGRQVELTALVPELKAADLTHVDPEEYLPKWTKLLLGRLCLQSKKAATLVTQSPSVRTVAVHTAADVKRVTESSVKARVVGSSSEHQQSSRSHAILALEVVSKAYLSARQRVAETRSRVAPIRNVLDNMLHHYLSGLVDFGASVDMQEQDEGWPGPGDFIGPTAIALKQFTDKGEWAQRRAAIDHLKAMVTCTLELALKATVDAEDALAELEHARPILGGRLVLCDLAGADYDKRALGRSTSMELKESAAINTSLLALKNCLRAIAGVPGAPRRPPFRDSLLTRILEHSLQPRGGARESVSVMLLSVAPSRHLEHMTVNTLRYGQLLASRSSRKQASTSRNKKIVAGAPSRVRRKAKHNSALDLQAELRRIYSAHCPEKTQSQVDAILARFEGRETLLLAKVRKKYLNI